MGILDGAQRLQTDDLQEYLLVIQPCEELSRKIMSEKISFCDRYDHESSLKAKPQIVVANFMAKEEMEITLCRWIQNICNLQSPFTATLNNYSGWPPHTIYLRIQDDEPFRKLANALKILDGFIQSNDCPPLALMTRPHIDIAQKLSACTYETAIKAYAQKIFHEAFRVEKLILLKRDLHMNCQLVNTFILPVR